MTLDIVCGSVTVRGSARSTVGISGTTDEPDTLQVAEAPGSISIDVRAAEPTRRWPGREVWGGPAHCADLVLDVPTASSVNVDSIAASMEMTGVTGGVGLNTASGNIQVIGGGLALSGSSVSGWINATGIVSGALAFQTVSGDIRVEGTPTELAADSVSGGITVAAGAGEVRTLELGTVSGAITVRGRIPAAGAWSIRPWSSFRPADMIHKVERDVHFRASRSSVVRESS